MLASQNIVIILCGNKKDLDADREVTFLEASRFAQENGVYARLADTCWLLLIGLHIVTVPIEVTPLQYRITNKHEPISERVDSQLAASRLQGLFGE